MNEVKFGVYLGPRGNLKILLPHEEKSHLWTLEEGKIVKHPIFRISQVVCKEMSAGWPIFEERGDLKGYEYLGDL